MLFGLIIWIPVGFIFGATLNGIVNCLLYAVISAILSEALVFYALSKGDLSISTVLIATYPVYTLLFSFLINNEKLTLVQILLVLITIIGTILTAFESDFKLKKLRSLSIVIPLITAISISISDTLTKGIINETSSFDFLEIAYIIEKTFKKDIDVFEKYEIIENSRIDNEIKRTGVVVYEKIYNP